MHKVTDKMTVEEFEAQDHTGIDPDLLVRIRKLVIEGRMPTAAAIAIAIADAELAHPEEAEVKR